MTMKYVLLIIYVLGGELKFDHYYFAFEVQCQTSRSAVAISSAESDITLIRNECQEITW